MHLFDLPYDIRYRIYEQLFPRGQQIYIVIFKEPFKEILRAVIPEDKVPFQLLLTCRALHTEASEYLYNSYLFNIIGTKRDCISNYERFLLTLKKHARNEVYVDAFSNGPHSATMCVSIHVGKARMALLKSRKRGQPKEIQEFRREVALMAKSHRAPTWIWSLIWPLLGVLAALAFALVASLAVRLGAVWFRGINIENATDSSASFNNGAKIPPLEPTISCQKWTDFAFLCQ